MGARRRLLLVRPDGLRPQVLEAGEGSLRLLQPSSARRIVGSALVLGPGGAMVYLGHRAYFAYVFSQPSAWEQCGRDLVCGNLLNLREMATYFAILFLTGLLGSVLWTPVTPLPARAPRASTDLWVYRVVGDLARQRLVAVGGDGVPSSSGSRGREPGSGRPWPWRGKNPPPSPGPNCSECRPYPRPPWVPKAKAQD